MGIVTSIKLITAATSNAVSLAEAKTHLRVDSSDEDTYISTLIVSAQRQVEAFTNRCLSDTVYEFNLSSFPASGIVLPFSPLKTLTSVKYYDGDNNQQTWVEDTDYYYSIDEEPPMIRYLDGTESVYESRLDNVIVRFTAGYTSPAVIPPGLQHAIKLLLTDLYEMRTDVPREKFTAWKSLAYPFRVFHSTIENT